MKQNSNKDKDDLMHIPEFFEWVIRPTEELDQYWNEFITQNPTREKELEDSVFIIESLIEKEKELSADAVARLWTRIENETTGKHKFLSRYSYWKFAAVLLLFLGISGILYYQLNQNIDTRIDYQDIAKVKLIDNEVKLIFADNSEEILHSKNLEIKYNSNGEIDVNSKKKLTQELKESNDKTEQLNQLVVPRGKRTSLILSDGTKLWLNSGSRVIFPVVFTKNKREIFIEGEAYLEVAHDPTKPFTVVTNKVQVKVLGTKFNISAYPEDPATSVVLVEGSIQTTIDSKKMTLKPNELLTCNIGSGKTEIKETDVLPYISWKDGWIYCQQEKLESIAVKLSRYYNIKIEFSDQKSKEMTLTGKLDLKSDCSEIFNAISSTAPISFEMKKDEIIISSK